MKLFRYLLPLFAGTLFFCGSASVKSATVPVGSSSLIGALDYSDTFTGTDYLGLPDRKTDGSFPLSGVDYPANGVPGEGLAVENNYGNPAQSWANLKFSLAQDGTTLNGFSTYPGGSGSGSATGITQSGGYMDEFGIGYGLRNRFVVQYDAVLTHDRVGFSIGPDRDVSVITSNNLFVFIRPAGTPYQELTLANLPTIGGETTTGLSSGLGQADVNTWHNFAALFDVDAKTIEVFVDQTSRGTIDLNTIAGGAYLPLLSNQNVNFSWADGNDGRFWTDNFQVGAPVPEPGTMTLVIGAAIGLCVYFRKK
jgi:hypothetical protein